MDIRHKAAFIAVVAGLSTLVSAGVLTVMGNVKPYTFPNQHQFKSAMMWLELANSPQEVFDNLGPLGDRESVARRNTLDAQNKYDFMFMTCYSLYNAALIFFVTKLNTYRFQGLLKLRVFLALGLLLACAMFIGDVVENLQLLELTQVKVESEVDPSTILTLKYWTRVKWGAIFLVCLMLSAGYTAYFRRVPAFLLPIAFAVAGISGLVALSVLDLRYIMEVIATPAITVAWFVCLIHSALYAYNGPRDRAPHPTVAQ